MRKERDYLWHVKPVWDRNSVAAWQGIISRGRQQLEPGAAGGEAGRRGREREKAPLGKARDGLSLPEQQRARPLCGMCRCSEDTSGPLKNKEDLEGRAKGDTHPIGRWLCTSKVLSLKQGVLYFRLGCCFWWEIGVWGAGALGQWESSTLSSFLPIELSLELEVWLLGEGGVRAQVPHP